MNKSIMKHPSKKKKNKIKEKKNTPLAATRSAPNNTTSTWRLLISEPLELSAIK